MLRFSGRKASIRGVPARDLSDEDLAKLKYTAAQLVATGLYSEVPAEPETPAVHLESAATDAQSSSDDTSPMTSARARKASPVAEFIAGPPAEPETQAVADAAASDTSPIVAADASAADPETPAPPVTAEEAAGHQEETDNGG